MTTLSINAEIFQIVDTKKTDRQQNPLLSRNKKTTSMKQKQRK